MIKTVWRAVLRVVGDKDRKFGTYSEDPVVTAKNLLESMGFRVGIDEQDRVLKIVKDLCGTTSHGSQPSNRPCVAIIHQIYGLFRDGKAMPKLFETSQMRWRQVAKQMGATYHLWCADEVDALIKKRFAFLWDTYKAVPFSVMRADIARVAILYHYGGMYVDLDVFPNTDIFLQAPLAVQKQYTSGYKTSGAKLRASKKQHAAYDKNSGIDIEVLIAKRENPTLMRWLCFIQVQIEKREFKKKSVWSRRPCRYIFSTTGPQCFQRFLRLWRNKEIRGTIQYISSNNFSHGQGLCVKEKRNFDVLSFVSNSYYSQKTAPFKIPAGDGEGPLPVLDGSQPRTVLRIRFTAKRRLVQQDVVSRDQTMPKDPFDDALTADLDQTMPKDPFDDALNADGDDDLEAEAHLACPVGACKWPRNTLAPDSTYNAASSSGTSGCASTLSISPPTKGIAVDQEPPIEYIELRDAQTQTEEGEEDWKKLYFCSHQLKIHVNEYKQCIATKTFLQDLSPTLRKFLEL